jgi:hypothetical protein
MAFGIAGLSVLVDSLSAIKYTYVRAIRDERGLITDFEIKGSYPQFGNDDDRVDSLAVEVAKNFISDLKKQPRQLYLETYDKHAIFQSSLYENLQVEELETQILRHLREAIADGEIHKSADLLRTVKMIAGIFYGVPLVSHMSFSTDLFDDYKDSLDYLFVALKHGRREVFYEK